jgi:predicted outer membrane repeat protein
VGRILILTLCLLWINGLAGATTHFIEPDGSGDFTTIQAAINASYPGDIIELANGTFTGDGNRNLDPLGKAITIQSSYANPLACIIDCADESELPYRGFHIHRGESMGTVISGITITNGCDDGESGGAIFCDETSPLIQNCRFVDNLSNADSGWDGGGAISGKDGASPTIENCSFVDNVSLWRGGAIYMLDADLTVIQCQFAGNSAIYGGAIYGSTVTCSISNSLFHKNSAYGGGAMAFGHGDQTITGCTIANNMVEWKGGGIRLGSANFKIYDSTIACNVGAGISSTIDTSVIMERCIIAFSSGAAGFDCDVDDTINLGCTDIYGNEGGDWVGYIADQLAEETNICADPLFCDPALTDFTIQENSPCDPENTSAFNCELIGAHPVGCSGTAIESASWGGIKAQYQSR